jgi:hypothetical protein
MWYADPANWFGIAGLAIGLIGLFYGWQSGRKQSEKIEEAMKKGIEAGKSQIEQLKSEQLAKLQEESQRRIDETREAGLKRVEGGLDGFDDKVCELVKEARKSVRLCLATPLLHSFRETWMQYDETHFYDHPTTHWARRFCEPLRHSLREAQRAASGERLHVEILHLDEKLLKTYVQHIPDPDNHIPFPEYVHSLDYFFKALKIDKACHLYAYPVPDIPIYLAIIDGPEGPLGQNGVEDIPPTAHGVVAFMSASEFLRQNKEDKRSAEQIAKNLQVYEFSNSEVVRFFTHLFREVSLHGDQQLLKFLQHCRTHSWKWAVIAEGIGGVEDIEPYATLLHSNAPPVEPSKQEEPAASAAVND